MPEFDVFSVVIAIVWTAIFGWRWWSMYKRESTGYVTEGEIVEVVSGWHRRGTTFTYYSHPVVRMHDQQGKVVQQQLGEQNVPFLWRKGVKIDVVYDGGVVYAASRWLKIGNAVFALLGVVMVIARLRGDPFFPFPNFIKNSIP